MKTKTVLSLLTLSILAVSPIALAKRMGPSTVSVISEMVDIHEVNQSLMLIGKLEAAESVVVASEVSGKVTNIMINANQSVAENEVLVKLDDAKAQASVKEAVAYLADEKRKLREFERLIKRNAITQTEIDAQATNVEIAQARLDAAKANLNDLHIRAPFAGTIGFIDFSRGKMVSVGTELLTLDDLSVMELDLQVPERYLGLLSEGMPVTARANAWGDQRFTGKVMAIDTRINPETLNLRVRINFENDDKRLKPGMLMNASLAFPAIKAPIIPVQALEYSGTKRFVYVIGEDNKVTKREVFLGARVDNAVVINSGVEIGERIVVQGVINMRDGIEVKEAGTSDTPSDPQKASTQKASKGEQ